MYQYSIEFHLFVPNNIFRNEVYFSFNKLCITVGLEMQSEAKARIV